MSASEDRVRDLVIDQATDWYLLNREPASTEQCAGFLQWLKSAPVNIEEYLAVHRTALDLASMAAAPETIEALVVQARHERDGLVQALDPGAAPAEPRKALGWRPLAAAAALLLALGAGFFLWQQRSTGPEPVVLTLRTAHGEQLTRRLPDDSVVHLNTDSALQVRLSAATRLISLERGEAEFAVTHEARPFEVLAGVAEVTAHGTAFAVRLQQDTTVVTVVEGAVGVAPGRLQAATGVRPAPVEVGANQQLRVSARSWPSAPSAVDAQRATAWLRKLIAFDNAPLAEVAAEFNRYAARPIEIDSPELRTLRVSGVFANDDPEAFVAFLRSLPEVQVAESAGRTRVSLLHARHDATRP